MKLFEIEKYQLSWVYIHLKTVYIIQQTIWQK